jgi:hypothetical protein
VWLQASAGKKHEKRKPDEKKSESHRATHMCSPHDHPADAYMQRVGKRKRTLCQRSLKIEIIEKDDPEIP